MSQTLSLEPGKYSLFITPPVAGIDFTGTPTPSVSYQWRKNGAAIAGQTATTITNVVVGSTGGTVDLSDGDTISIDIALTNPVSVVTKTVAAVIDASIPAPTVTPLSIRLVSAPTTPVSAISNDSIGSQIMVASAGSVSVVTTPPVLPTYQWRRDFAPIAGATSQTYTLQAADADSIIDCVVTATNSGGTTTRTAAVTIGTLPAAGWTELTASSDSRLIYVANNGNDAAAASVYGRGYYLPSDPEIGPDPTNPIGPIVSYANPRSALKRVRSTGFDPSSPIGRQHVSTAIRDATDSSGGGWPDWLLYRRGDTFSRLPDYQSPGWGAISGELGGMMLVGWGDNIGTWSGPQGDPMFRFEAGFFSGRSVSEPLVIGAWGPPTEPRPVIHGGFTVLPQLRNTVIASLDVQVSPDVNLDGRRTGLNFTNAGESAYGAWRNVLIEDCRSQGHGMIQISGGGPSTNLVLRRSVYTDGWNANGHNSSPYVGLAEGARLTFEECVFDRNGYKEDPSRPQSWTARHVSGLTIGELPAGTGVQPTRTWFDRNWYLSGKNGSTLRVRGNIASRTGGGSEQFRSGGVAERNLLLFNHDSFVSGGDPASNGDAPFVARGNVHLHDDAMLPPGGYGMNTFIRSLGGTYFVDNILAHNHFDQNGPGTLSISGWVAPWVVLDNVVRSARGLRGWGIEGVQIGKEVRNNLIAIDTPELWIGASPTASPSSGNQIDGNMYLGNASSPHFLRSYSGSPRDIAANTTFAQWQSAGYDPNGQMLADWSAFKTAAGWTDPDRDIVSYMQSIDPSYAPDEDVRVDFGCSGPPQATPQLVRNVVPGSDAQKRQVSRRFHAFVTFINRARENRKGAWDHRYTAEAVVNYIREGFGKAALTGPYDLREIADIASDYTT